MRQSPMGMPRPTPERRSLWTSARKKRKPAATAGVVDDEAAVGPSGENVKVLVRIRPMNEDERARRQMKTLSVFNVDRETSQQDTLFFRVPGESGLLGGSEGHGHTFTFDDVLSEESNQGDVFERVGWPVVGACLEGINATVFAYGQTGSGKTHTMHGALGRGDQAGLTPRVLQHLFARVTDAASTGRKIALRCSYVELYNEAFRDLLRSDSSPEGSALAMPAWNATPSRGAPPTPGQCGGQAGLRLREDAKRGVFIEGLTEISVSTADDAHQVCRAISAIKRARMQAVRTQLTGGFCAAACPR